MWSSAPVVAGALLFTAACSSGEVSIAPPNPAGRVVEQCDHLGNRVPHRLVGLHPRRTTPASSLTFAWGSPPVTLSCGVPKPEGFSPNASQTIQVDGVRWYQQIYPTVVVWTAVRSTADGPVYVALRVPTHYTAADSFLTALAQPLRLALSAT
ncbi:MAG TPA: DUF3515 family protein [Mycobacteriales bacterium]|nr:DUF3515 family protein [Mycobacteriales bacterium]